MIILQIEDGHLSTAPAWVCENEIHKRAIFFPFVKHHREVPSLDYPCAICGRPLQSRYFIQAFIYTDNSDCFSRYVYAHIGCMTAKFRQQRPQKTMEMQEKSPQGALF
jgi:hypothetical protein